jgi:hypothetical protein
LLDAANEEAAMSKKLAVGRRKAAMVGKQSATKRELIDDSGAATNARREGAKPRQGSGPRGPRRS